MKVLAGGRQIGKTTELVRMAGESEANGEVCYIVVHNHAEACRIASMAKRMELSIGFPLTYNEFLGHRYAGGNIHHFYIDNADLLLRSLTHVPIAAITLSLPITVPTE